VDGVGISRPEARIPGGGESRLGPDYSILHAVDGDSTTSWAGGSETNVEIDLPVVSGSSISQVTLRWNCRYLDATNRLGPAAVYEILVRDESTGLFQPVPLRRHSRNGPGWETNTFGDFTGTITRITDRVRIHLTSPEAGVTHYSLLEIVLQNGAATV